MSEIIAEIVEGQPFLEEALQNNYLNLTGFAEYIQPVIAERLGKPASIHAIKMALSRIKHPENLPSYTPRWNHNHINTIFDLRLTSILKTPTTRKLVGKIQSEESIGLNSYIAIIEGSREIEIFYDETLFPMIEKYIPRDQRILDISGLSLCSILLRDDEINQKGLIYSVTKKLAFHDINIIQMISTFHELGVVIQNSDLKKSVSVLMH